MFIPNNTGVLSRQGLKDIYSQPIHAPPVTVPCAIVTLDNSIAKSSVRTDSSASRQNAEERQAMAKILFPSYVGIGQGDMFEIYNVKLRALKVQPRVDVLGKLDHYEVDFSIWTR